MATKTVSIEQWEILDLLESHNMIGEEFNPSKTRIEGIRIYRLSGDVEFDLTDEEV